VNLVVPLEGVLAFCLALTRLLGVFLFAPIYGHEAVPMRVRVGLAAVLAWVAAPASLPELWSSQAFGLAIAREALIGVSLGFAASIVFSGFALMGELAAVQGGLGAAAVLDPSSGANSVVLSTLIGTIAALVFLVTGGHHEVLRAVFLSFEALPVGLGALPASGFASIASAGAIVFEVAVRIAAPFTVAMLASNVAVGMLGRAIPQLNLIALQLPAQIGLTLLLMALAAGLLVEEFAATLDAELPRLLGALWGAA